MLFKLVVLPIIIVNSMMCTVVLSRSWSDGVKRHHGRNRAMKSKPLQKARHQQDPNILQPRVVGGSSVWYGRAPYQLYYTYRGRYHCGASLVEVYGVQIALTATHCLWVGTPNQDTLVPPSTLKVIAGDLNLLDTDGREQTRDVIKIVGHGSYDARKFSNDITILFLEFGFDLNEWVDTITLPGYNWDQPEMVTITGWGTEKVGGPQHKNLQLAHIPTYDYDICEQYNQISDQITEKMMCVGDLGGNALLGSCTGDSGGPALSYNETEKKYYLGGIISHRFGGVCGSPWYPAVYTRVSKFTDWIRIEVSKFIEQGSKGDSDK